MHVSSATSRLVPTLVLPSLQPMNASLHPVGPRAQTHPYVHALRDFSQCPARTNIEKKDPYAPTSSAFSDSSTSSPARKSPSPPPIPERSPFRPKWNDDDFYSPDRVPSPPSVYLAGSDSEEEMWDSDSDWEGLYSPETTGLVSAFSPSSSEEGEVSLANEEPDADHAGHDDHVDHVDHDGHDGHDGHDDHDDHHVYTSPVRWVIHAGASKFEPVQYSDATRMFESGDDMGVEKRG